MAYYGTAPGWKPDFMEAAREGGKSVADQIAEARAWWSGDPDRPAAGVLAQGSDDEVDEDE